MRYTPQNPFYHARGLAGSSHTSAEHDNHEHHGDGRRVHSPRLHQSHPFSPQSAGPVQDPPGGDGMAPNWMHQSGLHHPTVGPEVFEAWRQGPYVLPVSSGSYGTLVTPQEMERQHSVVTINQFNPQYLASGSVNPYGYFGHGLETLNLASSVQPVAYEHDDYNTGLELNRAYDQLMTDDGVGPSSVNSNFMGLGESEFIGLGYAQQPAESYSGPSERNIDINLLRLFHESTPPSINVTNTSSAPATALESDSTTTRNSATTPSPPLTARPPPLDLVCLICQRSNAWTTYGSYVRHMSREHGEHVELFQCTWTDCEYSSIKATDVERHHNSCHDRIRMFRCPFCPREFPRKDNCRRHIRGVHHDDEEEPIMA